jgi:hypothetical protein
MIHVRLQRSVLAEQFDILSTDGPFRVGNAGVLTSDQGQQPTTNNHQQQDRGQSGLPIECLHCHNLLEVRASKSPYTTPLPKEKDRNAVKLGSISTTFQASNQASNQATPCKWLCLRRPHHPATNFCFQLCNNYSLVLYHTLSLIRSCRPMRLDTSSV